MAELREDPTAIVPERALVFEVASKVVDFYRAVRGVPGLEFLGEDEGEVASDDDFVVLDKGTAKPQKKVPRRFYFTMPDGRALQELVSLWRRFPEVEHANPIKLVTHKIVDQGLRLEAGTLTR